MVESLEPCPFCKARPHHGLGKVEHCQLHGEPFQRYRVWCPHNCAEKVAADKELAFAAWNTCRAPAAGLEPAIRKLEWREIHRMKWRGAGIFGEYEVRSNHTQRNDCWYAERPEDVGPMSYETTPLEVAKARAQSDYEARIRSALVPAVAGEAVRERDLLATAIAEAAQKAGIYNGQAPLTGPLLLMLADDLAIAALVPPSPSGRERGLREALEAAREKPALRFCRPHPLASASLASGQSRGRIDGEAARHEAE